MLSHPTLPVTITAQEDRHIRFYDNNTGGCRRRGRGPPPTCLLSANGRCCAPGQLIHAMVAHLDAVTCLAVDPNGLYLMSGSECRCSLFARPRRPLIGCGRRSRLLRAPVEHGEPHLHPGVHRPPPEAGRVRPRRGLPPQQVLHRQRRRRRPRQGVCVRRGQGRRSLLPVTATRGQRSYQGQGA